MEQTDTAQKQRKKEGGNHVGHGQVNRPEQSRIENSDTERKAQVEEGARQFDDRGIAVPHDARQPEPEQTHARPHVLTISNQSIRTRQGASVPNE